ncbi:MAG: 6-oxocyclohex-1-ene-1-carbonyl-CoA hydratase [Flavobacteriales bacterium]|nr:6-oxocyclohex-1-ene-1-carbonyl-CoA hydrolase [Flavobacteriales bacterium]MCC6578505.1 6-oxocyclohex-1-ene-1-carbonyl-CoA hydratase [Flavobacteriales bacterium]NUQ15053.1 6-oxocyclohex-1-ene-1-carbonyl-CoA hydratase [Flavobacteriales bacterium]
MELKDHNLTRTAYREILFEKRPCRDHDGSVVPGLFNAWIILNNPAQFNSYTTQAVKEVTMAFAEAGNDRSVVAVVFTAVGDKAFCTGGNTREYAEYYAGNPQEYAQYMRLFNDMVSGILKCDKPVINRVNGMRIAGGQEIGMACDFTVASDLARFGQAGPKHGSAAIGGSTDFLHLHVGYDKAAQSLTFCEHWSAHYAKFIGLVTEIVPALRIDGRYVPNPLVVTDRFLDDMGNIVYGQWRTGDEAARGRALLKQGTVDLGELDKAVDRLIAKLLHTFPNCTVKSLSEIRKKKLEHWDRNKESSREWLALNMMTEARAGFKAFNEGPKDRREVDFVKLRQLLAEGRPWDEEMHRAISPQYRTEQA